MKLTIDCKSCGCDLKIRERMIGRPVRCPLCEQRFTVPSKEDLMHRTWRLNDFDVKVARWKQTRPRMVYGYR